MRTIHAWGGFVLAALIIVVSLSGTLLLWKKEYLWLNFPEARGQFEMQAKMAADITTSAEQQFGIENVRIIQFGIENLRLHKAYLADGSYAYLDDTANVLATWRGNERIEELIFDFHHRLLLDSKGLWIIAMSALCLFVFVIFGIIIWWKKRADFTLKVIPKHLLRPFLLASHRDLGIIMALPVMLVLATGVALSYPDETKNILVEPFTDNDLRNQLYENNLDSLSGESQTGYLAVFERAQASFPDALLRGIRPVTGISDHVTIQLQHPDDWHQSGLNTIYIDAREGYMDMRLDAQELPRAERIFNTSYPLHTAKIDSLIYKIWQTLVGTSLFLLSLYGLLSFGRYLLKRN